MIDLVKVSFSFDSDSASFDKFFRDVREIASSYHVDFNLRICRNNITVNVYPFRYEGAQLITVQSGAKIISSLVNVFVDNYPNASLLFVDMTPSIPF